MTDARWTPPPPMSPPAYEPLLPPGPIADAPGGKPKATGLDVFAGLAVSLGVPFLLLYLADRIDLYRFGGEVIFGLLFAYLVGVVGLIIWSKRAGRPGLRIGLTIGASLWLLFITACGLILWAIFSGGGI